MTCPHCARQVRCDLRWLYGHHLITDAAFVTAYRHTDPTKEHDMHARLIFNPVNGDIGIEEETWEVLPDHVPAEAPVEVPSEPVPA